MLSRTRGMPVHSSALGVIPDTITDPASNGASAASDADGAPPQASAAPGQSYPARGSAATERDERRHQRAVAREGNGRDGAKTAERLQPAKAQPPRGRLVIGETVSVGLIGIIVVGLIAGAILGALGASGWVIGLLVATLTVILSAVLRRSARQR
jgi:hypothetical protein